jgi:hypothetical protein
MDALLERMVGTWGMTGTVRGRPATYTREVARALQRRWIGTFGAAYSIPHATGEARGDTLLLAFPYPDGPFRDTFVYDRSANSWCFRLESADRTGGWRLFAEYQVRHR